MENSVIQTSSNDDYFIQKKLEIMMDMYNKKVANEFSKLNSMISKLNDEISQLKRNINNPVRAEQTKIFETSTKEVKESPKNDDQAKPRYGDYKPEDVSIGKFFYCGSGAKK